MLVDSKYIGVQVTSIKDTKSELQKLAHMVSAGDWTIVSSDGVNTLY